MSAQAPKSRSRVRTPALDVFAAVLIVAVAGVFVWQHVPSFTMENAKGHSRIFVPPITIGAAPVKGADTARIALLAFSDFECAFCRSAATGPLKAIETTYISSGRLRLIFKHFPLPKHTSGRKAAIAATCALAQHKFWEMHDALFENQSKLTDEDLSRYPAYLGVNYAQFELCRSANETASMVDADIVQGKALGITATPTFYFGMIQPDGRLQVTDVLVGARPIADFTSIIDRLLSKGS